MAYNLPFPLLHLVGNYTNFGGLAGSYNVKVSRQYCCSDLLQPISPNAFQNHCFCLEQCTPKKNLNGVNPRSCQPSLSTNPFAIFGFFSLYSSTNLLKLLLVCFIIWFTYSCFLINLFSHRRCTIFYFLIKFKNQILTQNTCF